MLKQILGSLLLALPIVATASGMSQLKNYYQDVHALSGEFVQTTRDDSGRVLEEAEGKLLIQRPDRFAWTYQVPFEQEIVADGKTLWVYDVDLEQVTARPLEQVLGVGPALLLSGDYASLQEAFQISDEGQGWIKLTPRSGEWDFQDVRLKLEDGVPRKLRVDSGFGQTTELELLALERNPRLDPARFKFEAPAGVDVIEAAVAR